MQYRIKALEESIEKIAVKLEEARAHGDTSENAEYEASLAEFTSAKTELAELEYTLANSVVKTTVSDSIEKGTLFSMQEINSKGEVLKDYGMLLFDDVGSVIFYGVISPNSPLGKVIQGGTSGVYTVKDFTNVEHHYKITVEPESRINEYLEKYPPSIDPIVDKIFAD